ncbi:unnamed protein product [Meloidogyne enterolobii]|uniref:Uncharacterized protein n=1 Tax=Meloidogyne enterolobii TaxID=390850 RepID=A0ACB0YT14_MELEN
MSIPLLSPPPLFGQSEVVKWTVNYPLLLFFPNAILLKYKFSFFLKPIFVQLSSFSFIDS